MKTNNFGLWIPKGSVRWASDFRPSLALIGIGVTVVVLFFCLRVEATPANKAALARHYDRFLAANLNKCSTCHLPAELGHPPENLDEFPHNPFGRRLRLLGKELSQAEKKKDIATRLAMVAGEDSDGDGVPNEVELLLGHNPGDAKDKPGKQELATATRRRGEFARFLASYRWDPFRTVERPPAPKIKDSGWIHNPIDAFIAAERQARGLKPRPEAAKEILLRRVYLDLIGLSPTSEEQRAFMNDKSAQAYEKVVDRLLADPRYGERWGRHWMDIWRYSDWAGWTDGGQVRDSKPHIWRWRDWIVESLNQDKPYDRMIVEMLAADELAPEDTNALRATGYLVRNYKMLSREQWLEDTVKHTAQAFLGLTVGCAKCHDHMFDPISQKEYYQIRAIFEPHQVRTDHVPGQVDTAKDGLVRVYDTDTNAPTYFFVRGDERQPDTNRVMTPGILQSVGGRLNIAPVSLPRFAALPDKRAFVIEDSIAAGEKALTEARQALEKLGTDSSARAEKIKESELNLAIAEEKQASLLATIRAEKFEDTDRKDSDEWRRAAIEATAAQRKLALAEATLKLHLARVAQGEAQTKADEAAKALTQGRDGSLGRPISEPVEVGGGAQADEVAAKAAVQKKPGDNDKVKKEKAEKAEKDLEAAKKKTTEVEKAFADAQKELQSDSTTAYKPRPTGTYPAISTGRRLAFARWVASADNPLTARVAMNHIWLRHFGQGIVPTPADFGRNGRPPSHPQLLDWLAAEFMAQHWSIKAMQRLIVTSSAYRMASTADEADARIDPDNVYFWRMNSRRMEAEIVRDNLLYVSGDLDPAVGGPDIDNKLGLTSKRRSVYLRIAAEKEVEFLKIFDGPNVTECYTRKPSVMPQQALALANSELTLREARRLAERLTAESGAGVDQCIIQAFLKILARTPNPAELSLCRDFLVEQSAGADTRPSAIPSANRREVARAWENLVLILFNHNDFVTIR